MARKGLLRQSNKPKAQNTPHKIKGIIRQKKAEQKKEAKSSSLFSSLGLQAKANSTEPILRQTNSETILAKDSAVVHLSGAETITGNKTFRGAKIILEPSNPTGNYSYNELDNEKFIVGNDTDFSEYNKEEISYYTNAQNSIMKFPSGGKSGTIVLDCDLQEYSTSSHTHPNLVSPSSTTEIWAIDDFSKTGGTIQRTGVMGALVEFTTTTSDSAARSIRFTIRFPLPSEPVNFTRDTITQAGTVEIEAIDETVNQTVIPRQTVALNFSKYGWNSGSDYIGFTDGSITFNPDYQFPASDWSESIYSAPMQVLPKGNGFVDFGEFWGVVSFSTTEMFLHAWNGTKIEEIETVEHADNRFSKPNHVHNKIIETNNEAVLGFDFTGGYGGNTLLLSGATTLYICSNILGQPTARYSNSDFGVEYDGYRTYFGNQWAWLYNDNNNSSYRLSYPEKYGSGNQTIATLSDLNGFIPYTHTSGVLVGDPNYAEATGKYAIALGSAVHATGQNSVALGSQASALALNAVAIGGTSLAKSIGSLAMNGGKAYGAQSIAIGAGAEASGNFSYAVGRTAKANDIYALALGGLYNQSDAKYSITMGFHSRAYPQSQHSFTWNGNTSLGIQNEYAANGGGTFNINPSAGISGFYIGTKNLYTILSEQGGGATGDFLPLSGGEVSADFKLTVNGGTNFLSGGTDEVTLALGRNSVAYNGADTAIGAHCSVEGYDNTALGCQSSVGKANSSLPGPDGGAEEVALGAYSHAMGGLDCVQLGRGTNNEPYSLKVLGTQTLMSKSGQSSDDLVLVCPVSGYLALTGGEVSGNVNEEIDWPYIRMENVLLQDESDGTSNKVLVNISIEATSAELYLGKQTGDCPSPITVNTEIVGVTGNPSQLPFDIAALSGEKQVPYNTSDKFYEYTNGNSQIEIYIEPTGAISYYFVTSDDEHYYGTESIPPTETTKKISSRFITEAEIDSKIKSGGAAFDRWRKGNTIYAGTGSDHLSAGTNNSVFIGSNQTITDGKGNSVVIGSNTQSKTGSVVVIGNNAKVTDANSTGHVVIGANSQGYGYGASVAVGNSAKACYLGVAIGPEANAEHENAVAVGWRTKPRTNKDIAIGREAQTSGGDGNFSNIAIGAWSKAFSTGGNTAIAIGGGTVSGNMSIAFGGSVYANDAIQLGNGNNTTPNTLQYRDHKIADTAGKLYYNNTDIASMFATKNDLSDAVKISGNQSISGDKIFANQIQVASDVNSSFNDYFGRGCVSMNSTNGSHTTFLYGAASYNFWDGSAPVLDIVDFNGQKSWVYIFPTENTYPSGGTFKVAVKEDANLIKVDNEFVDTSTATTSFLMKPEYGEYRGAVGSNGILPTFDWTHYNLSSINANTVYHFHVSLYVNAGASTLTDPNSVNWVTGAGLPNSGFAGHWIFMSFMKENFTNTIHGSVWRVG